MTPLARFNTEDMLSLTKALPKVAPDAQTMDEAASAIADFMYRELIDDKGGAACALVRIYKTHPFGTLPPALQTIARGVAGSHALTPEPRCLTLLGTAGAEAAWNDRRQSNGHQAIPLVSASAVQGFPMIARLFEQLGMDVGSVLEPQKGLIVDASRTNFNVFHVPEAAGSPYIPAQDFVRGAGVQSVVGCGGRFLSGNVVAMILFSKVPVAREPAMRFQTLASSLLMKVMPFEPDRVFGS